MSINYTNLSINTYDNIFLIKSTITQNTINNYRVFNNDYITNKGFTLILPEKLDVSILFKIIYNSKNIILSWGCCSYLNSIFVNEKSNVLVLCHIGYKVEYDGVNKPFPGGIFNSAWFPTVANKKLILYDLNTEINELIQ
jgi:hypothetical protein